ncbi:MAG: DNA-directed RNA polymerase subunit beta' [Candidatus Paceibacterota bacterium]
MRKETSNRNDFDSISIKLASPEVIREWSYGEVTKPETINYRTQRSEKSGLFDEKIFGPEKDYECFCGKYKGIRYKGIVCDRCGVEITRAIVRRERMGHIELATPVAHIWFLRSIPSRIGLLLGTSAAEIERVVYFAGYIVKRVIAEERERFLKEIDTEYKTRVQTIKDEKEKKKLKELLVQAKQDLESIQPGVVLDEMSYHKFSVKYGTMFEAGIGAEAVHGILKDIDLAKLEAKLLEERDKAGSVEKAKLNKRLALVRSMLHGGVRPEWMFMSVLPVIPPGLRPMVALEGGRHATSDLNDLYRRVINRNNRLKKLMDINAPEVILRNEKRILQEAVDALIDNSIRHGNTMFSAMNQSQRRPLKSLADYLKGKQGYFRQNLLGKRVDYSGRSVIIVGPDLELDECGLPKHMALELFRPFVIAELLRRELAFNIRGAGRLIEEREPEVWAILEEVIEGKYVLLNRAPTLHRQGIQAFRPVLIEGNAIQVHPLVCPAFNADFDGDQMAVHVPLSEEAQLEAKNIMAANRNILKPGNGDPIVATKMLDISLGCYWMTKIVEGEKGEGKVFPTVNSAITAYDFGEVGFRAKIKVLPSDHPKYTQFGGKIFETSVGRLLFNSVLPNDFPFINDEIKKGSLLKLSSDLIDRYGLEDLPPILDKIKSFGFKYATKSGTTWGMGDLKVPEQKEGIVAEGKKKQEEILTQYNEGLLSRGERKRMLVEVWQHVKNQIEEFIPDTLDPNGSVNNLVHSGARGSMGQITQMAGMKGLVQNTRGETIEFPIIASMKEGLTPIEYFITTHGARKGLADTALQTAKAGYLTRKLFDVAQNAVVREKDCGTKEGTLVGRESASGIEIDFAEAIRGRVLAKDIEDETGNAIYKRNHFITLEDSKKIADSGVTEILIRSPMTCKTRDGICQHCYGMDVASSVLVDLGEAVGTVAAQAIGEPGTQLTMRTFHTGGVATVGGDITSGLPRVEEVFERRSPKNPAAIAHISGVVSEVTTDEKGKVIRIVADATEKTGNKKKEVDHTFSTLRMTLVKVGAKVEKGDLLTDGSSDLQELFKYGGKEKTQEYIIQEATKIYELQGVTISRKHIEVIVKQMFSRRKIKESGDSRFSVGDVVEDWDYMNENDRLKEEGQELAVGELVILGIAEVSLTRKSFLSAASFQHTTKVLINASIRGTVDKLRGLKENVIIGRLIPAGTGFEGSKKAKQISDLQEEGNRTSEVSLREEVVSENETTRV